MSDEDVYSVDSYNIELFSNGTCDVCVNGKFISSVSGDYDAIQLVTILLRNARSKVMNTLYAATPDKQNEEASTS